MNGPRDNLVKGAICGAFASAGLMFLLFWQMLTSSPNAGAMVDGRFQPYQNDPTWSLMAGGGAVLLVAGLGFFAWTWRDAGR